MSRTIRKDFYEKTGKATRDKKKWYKPGRPYKEEEKRRERAKLKDRMNKQQFDMIYEFKNCNVQDYT